MSGPRILMTTEGTYPYVVGGVSTWCMQLIAGIPEVRWQVLPITAGCDRRDPIFSIPPQAKLLPRADLWSDEAPPWRLSGRSADRTTLPADLVRELLGWNGDVGALADALVWCRRHPHRLRAAFRRDRAWRSFLAALTDVLDERCAGVGPVPELDLHQAGQLYQVLYWLARVAAVPTPPTDLLLVTAAGWAVVPALVHRALHGTPILVTEHGVYVREAYLAAVRADDAPGARFVSTRLARGLAVAAYASADMISPVSEANGAWEEAMGAPPSRIRVIRNCAGPLPDPAPLPGGATVISVGRLDPLKDVHTLLEVAAEVVRHVPQARFLHYGPVPPGQEAYAESCHALHAHLDLGDRFRFMGGTKDPIGVLRDADIVIMTSISEGFPMSLLEAMSQGRPIVTTAVGGVPEAVRGCSVLAPPGDVSELAMGVVTLLREPSLARVLGERGRRRVVERFGEETWLNSYRELLFGLSGAGNAA